MRRAYSLHGRNSRPKEGNISTRLASPPGALLAGPDSKTARASSQALRPRRAAATGHPGLIAPIGPRPLILLPRKSERPHFSTFLAPRAVQRAFSGGRRTPSTARRDPTVGVHDLCAGRTI